MSTLERILSRPFMMPETGDGAGEASATTTPAETSAPAEPEKPVEEEFEIEAPADATEESVEQTAKPEAPKPDEPVEEFIEFDDNGDKVKIPKRLRPYLMAQADYSRNIQRVSETLKALDAQRAEIAAVSQEKITKAGQLAGADEMIDRYQKLDWARLEAEDQALAQTRLRELHQWQITRDQLAREVASIDQKIADDRRQRELETQQDTARRIQEAYAVLDRDIPNWATVGPKVMDYATKVHGYHPQELASQTDPRLAKLLHKAMLADELAQKQQAAAQQRAAEKTKAQQATVAPLETVTPKSGGPTTRVSLEKASMDQYIAIRKRQEADRQKANR